MTNKEKKTLLILISEGKLQEALSELLSMPLNKNLKREAIALSSRFKNLQQRQRMGTLSSEQFSIQENQITNNLINLLDQVADPPQANEALNKRKNNKTVLHWGLIIGSFIIITLISIYVLNRSEPGSPQLTIFVTDTKGNVVLEHDGILNTSIGNRPMRETIGEHGRTNFGDILPKYLGDTLSIGIEADDWEIAETDSKFIFTGKPIQLKVKKKSIIGTVKGIVKTRDGQTLIEGAKVLINADTFVFTDNNGIFNILLPDRMWVRDVTEGYKLMVSKEGFKTRTRYFYVKSSDAEIRLEKTE
jgi:hypothetical protein